MPLQDSDSIAASCNSVAEPKSRVLDPIISSGYFPNLAAAAAAAAADGDV